MYDIHVLKQQARSNGLDKLVRHRYTRNLSEVIAQMLDCRDVAFAISPATTSAMISTALRESQTGIQISSFGSFLSNSAFIH